MSIFSLFGHLPNDECCAHGNFATIQAQVDCVCSLTGQTLTGSSTLKVKVTDAAGNDGTVYSQAYTLDTTAPTTTIATAAFSADTGTSSTDFITKTAAQDISGTLSTTLASGETVYVSLDNGSNITSSTGVTVSGVEAGATWQYSTDSGNTWSAAQAAATTSFTLAEGTYATGAVQVRQTDAAGNVSTVSSSTSSWTISS